MYTLSEIAFDVGLLLENSEQPLSFGISATSTISFNFAAAEVVIQSLTVLFTNNGVTTQHAIGIIDSYNAIVPLSESYSAIVHQDQGIVVLC